jgi:hypothetical protein
MKRHIQRFLLFALLLFPFSSVHAAASYGVVLPPAPNAVWEPGLSYQVVCIAQPMTYQNCNVILLQNGYTLTTLGQVTLNAVGVGVFKWTIPAAQKKDSNYQIRFANQANTMTVDSAKFSINTVQRTIRVVQPAGITQAKVGDTITLSWSYTGHSGSVSDDENRVWPSFLAGNTVYAVSHQLVGNTNYSSAPIGQNGSGSCTWKIPVDCKDSPGAYFSVTWSPHGTGGAGSVSAKTDTFHLVNEAQVEAAGYIDVLTPQAGASTVVGSVLPITWKFAKWMNTPVNISLGYDNPIAANVPIGTNGAGSYNWTVGKLPYGDSSNYRIYIQTITKSHQGYSQPITLKCGQPGIAVNTPQANETWEIGTTRYITWNAGIPASTPFDIELVSTSSPNQPVRTIYTGLQAVQQNGMLTYGWSIPAGFPTGTYCIRVSKNGNSCPTANSSPFTLAGPGKITLTYPTSGQNIAMNEVKRITWKTQAHYDNMYVKIDLYRHPATKVMNIAQAVLNPLANGQAGYDWTVPSTLQAGTNYYIVLELTGLNAATGTSSDPKSSMQQFFNITAPPLKAITPVAPANLKPLLPQ